MQNNKLLLICLFGFFNWVPNKTHAQTLSNQFASKETAALYKNLQLLSKKHTLFGHQDDLAYGVNWKYKRKRSDIKDVVNDYPAVYGWDISGIEKGKKNNIDQVPFSKIKKYIVGGYKRGAVITLSWHFDNPLTGGSSWDTTQNSLASILPGGNKHELYKTWLDKAAEFMLDLKGKNNEPIPLLFRPFHELTGDWFWWGKKTSSPEQIKQAWQFTVNYLRQEKKLNNLLLVYNANDFATEQEFLERYPGDDMVDILSFDKYQFGIKDKDIFIDDVRKQLDILTKVTKNKNKIAAIAETGFESIPDSTWWTETLLPIIKDYELSYVLVWRNAGYMPLLKKMHYYAPFKGHASENDFAKFYQTDKMLFEKKLGLKNIYR